MVVLNFRLGLLPTLMNLFWSRRKV